MGPGLTLRVIREWVEKPGIHPNQSGALQNHAMMRASPLGRLPDPIAEQLRRCGLNVMRLEICEDEKSLLREKVSGGPNEGIGLLRTSAGNVTSGAKNFARYPASWVIDPLKAAAMRGEKSRIDRTNQAHLSANAWPPGKFVNAKDVRRLKNNPRRARFGTPTTTLFDLTAEARPALPCLAEALCAKADAGATPCP